MRIAESRSPRPMPFQGTDRSRLAPGKIVESVPPPAPVEQVPLLEIKGLCKSYGTAGHRTEVLRDINLRLGVRSRGPRPVTRRHRHVRRVAPEG
ncbi:MAG: hypothetical protein ACREXW_13720 [Gammaproteobacteria bacterium]